MCWRMRQQVLTKAQVVVPKQRAIYDALQRYAADNNGKYPQSLKQLVPKYVAEDPTQPIRLHDGTEVRLVYYQSRSQSSLIARQALQRLPYPIPTH